MNRRKSPPLLPLVMTALLLLCSCATGTGQGGAHVLEGMPDPLIEQRADPWIYRHTDGFYYFTATVPEYDRLELRRSPTLSGLAEAVPEVVWRKHVTGEMGAHIWAPEIHYIDGKWYIYFAAGKAESPWEIRPYVLESSSENPLEGTWTEKGRIETDGDPARTGMRPFALDGTTFEHRGVRYFLWAQNNRKIPGNTNLYIAEMENPWTIKGNLVMISRPDHGWEQRLYMVNEGPAVLIRNGRIFLTYSASGTDFNYCMGLLTAEEEADLLDPSSWTKRDEPVFQSSDETGIYGPGHSCFTTTEDGQTDVLVYHARSYKFIDGDPLDDPNRHTRLQKILWTEEGTPDFGVPVPEN